MAFPKLTEAVRAIDRRGILLVYPLDNRTEPASLWSEFFPRTKMRWEWDSGGDDRVARLWHLREELSRSSRVVYAKWFRGRATFFSREAFADLLALLAPEDPRTLGLPAEALQVLEALELDSPLSTKELKERCGLQGRFHESTYQKATKALWERLLLVGYGEKDDGAFPSLMMGATRLLFEDLWSESRSVDPDTAADRLRKRLSEGEAFRKFLAKLLPERGFAKATR